MAVVYFQRDNSAKFTGVVSSFPSVTAPFPREKLWKHSTTSGGRNVLPGLLVPDFSKRLRLRIVHAIHIANMAMLVFASLRSPSICGHGSEMPVLACSMTDCEMTFSAPSSE
jgi:hypothetical protein